jgi:UTP:GlnB (protein PII) uridylyltransferase
LVQGVAGLSPFPASFSFEWNRRQSRSAAPEEPRARQPRAPKVTVETRINFDDTSSAHNTLLEIVTQDHPGLLYEIGSARARLGCNIEVALIDEVLQGTLV